MLRQFAATTRIIIPYKGVVNSKSRLAGLLSHDQRASLSLEMLVQVLSSARAALEPDNEVCVITPSRVVMNIARSYGAGVTRQRGIGLNPALNQAVDEASMDGVKTLLILHADLPRLDVHDVRAILAALPVEQGIALAPDRTGVGTNALAFHLANRIPLRFGFASHRAHCQEARSRGLRVAHVIRPGLSLDIDTPADLAEWPDAGSDGWRSPLLLAAGSAAPQAPDFSGADAQPAACSGQQHIGGDINPFSSLR